MIDFDQLTRAELKSTLERVSHTGNHLKTDLLFELAWEYGHSSGNSEVEGHYDDLRDLLT